MKSKTTPKPVEIVTDMTQYTPHCPRCREPIAVQATVEKFNEPYKWDFWGRPSQRWIKCRGDVNGRGYVHFVTLINERPSHRLAWLAASRADTHTQMELTL